MALLFDASTELVNCGSGSSTANLFTGTVIAWIYPTSITASSADKILQRGLTGNAVLFDINNLADADFRMRVYRATTAYEVNSVGSLFSVNGWSFVAASFNTSLTNTDQYLYYGNLSTVAAEVSSYAGRSIGSGSFGDNSAVNQIIGNRSSGGNDFPGRIAWVGMWNRQLSLGEIQAQQFRPHVTSGCVLFMHLGANGTGTQADWSGNGNNGTVTGATVADHVPIRPWFGESIAYAPWYSASLPTLGISIEDVAAYRNRGVKVIG